jgi:hypothetical protein
VAEIARYALLGIRRGEGFGGVEQVAGDVARDVGLAHGVDAGEEFVHHQTHGVEVAAVVDPDPLLGAEELG